MLAQAKAGTFATSAFLLAAMIVSVTGSSALAGELPAIMVLNIKNEEQASPGLAKILTELVLQNLTDLKRFRIIGVKDIEQMLNTEQRKQLTGCNDTSCLVEIAGAMGTQYTLDGTVGVVGSSNVLSLSLIDVTKASVVSRKTSVVKGENEQLLESVHRLIAELMWPVLPDSKTPPPPVSAKKTDPAPMAGEAKVAKNPPATPQTSKAVEYQMNPYKLWGLVGVCGGVAVGGLGGIFSALASTANEDYKTGKDPSGSKSSFETNTALATTSFVLGSAMIVTGAVLWYLSPGDEAWAKKHAVSIAPDASGNGATMTVSGVW